MLSRTTQNYQVNEILLNEVTKTNSPKIISESLERLKTIEIGQVKVYFGIGYFVVLTMLIFSLLF